MRASEMSRVAMGTRDTHLRVSGESARTPHVWGAKQIAVRTSLAFRLTARGRHLREVANTRGKSPSHEDEHRWADSPSRRRLCQFGLRPPTFSRDAFPGCFWLTLVQCQGRSKTRPLGRQERLLIHMLRWRFDADKPYHRAFDSGTREVEPGD